VIGGALGNLIDRLMHGHVIDFIQWHWKEVYYYPSFNIADSAIVGGAIVLVLFGVFGGRGKNAAEGG
jgi:signal peptidase II